MTFIIDQQELKPGLIIFRRGDVEHRRWYCRMKVPKEDRYKTISLKTSDVSEAKDKAYDHDAELRFKVKHEMPMFNRTFAQVAQEYANKEKDRADVGQITHHRWRVLDSHIRTQLNRFLGKSQISLLAQDRWQEYPIWRQKNGKGRSGGRVSDGTIRSEMATLKAIMAYAASKHYIRENQAFKGKLPLSKVSREEFTPQEYRKLHTFARKWIKEGRHNLHIRYRTITYNFILIMTNTGMRPTEAKNLRWRDVSAHTDKQDRQFVRLSVRGKDKHRNLVAASNVATYFERIREISKATKPDGFVFTNDQGKPAKTLYHSLIEKLLIESELLHSSSGSRRSTYCFRHTYATFRLTEGVDVYFLAKQMGTSVKMIEDHYGHVNPVKNAERILQGIPGWEPIADGSGGIADNVNAGAAGAKPPKPEKKK
ncbi:MAG TPA: site-specific integrase [Terriglobia bacterium]|nr:site-specific integrase [Terriglobia bacterium]